MAPPAEAAVTADTALSGLAASPPRLPSGGLAAASLPFEGVCYPQHFASRDEFLYVSSSDEEDRNCSRYFKQEGICPGALEAPQTTDSAGTMVAAAAKPLSAFRKSGNTRLPGTCRRSASAGPWTVISRGCSNCRESRPDRPLLSGLGGELSLSSGSEFTSCGSLLPRGSRGCLWPTQPSCS